METGDDAYRAMDVATLTDDNRPRLCPRFGEREYSEPSLL